MKSIRYMTFITSAVCLVLLALGTIHGLVEFAGGENVIDLILSDATVLYDSYVATLCEVNLNYDWFAKNGPVVLLVSLITTLIVSKP